jgi:hypothetical protein
MAAMARAAWGPKRQSYREISHRLGLSKNTVLDIVKRDRTDGCGAA